MSLAPIEKKIKLFLAPRGHIGLKGNVASREVLTPEKFGSTTCGPKGSRLQAESGPKGNLGPGEVVPREVLAPREVWPQEKKRPQAKSTLKIGWFGHDALDGNEIG